MNLILSDSGPYAGGGRYKLYNTNGEEIYANDGPSIYTLINPYRAMSGIFTLKITYGDGCSATTEQFIQVFTGFNSVTVIDVIHPTVGNSDGGFTVLVPENLYSQARVKCLSINPKFPIRQSTKLYSDGKLKIFQVVELVLS